MAQRLRDTLREHYGGVEVVPLAGGHTLAERGIARLPEHGRCFVKAAYDERTRAALAREASVLEEVDSPHLPRLIRHEPGLLIVEDLSDAHWPPPWVGDLRQLWTALKDLRNSSAPSIATPLEDDGEEWDGVDTVAGLLGDPLATWLTHHLDRINESALSVSPVGSAFVHADLSLENLCAADRGVVVVDWEFASIGSPDLDVATVSLELIAGGCSPDEVPLTDPAPWAARLATWLLAGSAGHSEWAKDPEVLRTERLRLAGAALRWWADEVGVDRPPLIRDAGRSG